MVSNKLLLLSNLLSFNAGIVVVLTFFKGSYKIDESLSSFEIKLFC